MGAMKDFDRRIRQGGDDAIAAVNEYTSGVEGWLKSFAALAKHVIPCWIPVEERLPSEHACVLAYHSNARRIIAWHDGNGWQTDADTGGRGDVTHWMPLLEPPEVK